jgi:two-component system cell cycle sensor histidine kinase/response regulator CckA
MELAADGVLVLHEDRIEAVNTAACELLGWPREEVVGRAYSDLVDPDDLLKTPLRDAGPTQGSTLRIDRLYRTAQGPGLPVELSGRRLPDGRFQVVFRDQRERHRVEAQLRQSEARWRSLVHATAQILWITDATGAVLEDLPAWRAFTGQTVAQMHGRGWLDAVHVDDAPRALAQLMRSIRDKTPHDNEFRLRRQDGEYRQIAMRAVPVIGERGEVLEWVGTCTDVTDRRATQRALHAKQEELRLITDTVPVLIAHIDCELRFRFANRACEAWFNRSHDDVVGRPLREVLGDAAFETMAEDVARVLTGERVVFERRIPKGNSSNLMHADLLPRCNAAGEVEGFVALFMDLTERDLVEQALLKKEEDLRVTTDLVPVQIAFVDKHFHYRFVNRAYELAFDVPAGDIEGRTIAQLQGEETFSLLRADMERALAGDHVAFERMLPFSGVGERFIHGEYLPRRNREGEVEGFVVLGIDLTERKRADEALQHSEEQLRQSQKMDAIGRLAGGIAHDFNNLLTAINGYSELMMMMLRPDEPMHAHAEEIRRAGERAAALTRQLLTFSRKQVLAPKVQPLGGVVADMDRLLRRLIAENIELVVEQEGEPGLVKADPSQLEQVVLNLVINARDAMPHGGRITVRTDRACWEGPDSATFLPAPPGEYVRLTVQDTGRGIEAAARTHLFEPFFSTKETGKGTGLGLSTVYGIVKQAGGAIRVVSRPKHGSTFEIWLPRVQVSERLRQTGRAESIELPRGCETVLLVEDEPAVRSLVARVLTNSGYRVFEASSGHDGWQAFQTHAHEIDLLLTDVVMPGIGGRELADRVRARRPDIKVLYMSGYMDDPALRQVLMQTHATLLSKPFSPRTVAQRVREMLDATPAPLPALRKQPAN